MKKNYYIFDNGELKRKDNTIYLVTEEESKAIPVKNVGGIHIFGEVSFNTRFFDFLGQEQIPAHYYDWHDRYEGSYYPQEFLKSGNTLVKQSIAYKDRRHRRKIAKEIVIGASNNMISNLQYYRRKGKDVDDVIDSIKSYQESLSDNMPVEDLMGVEGKIRKQYYDSFDIILRDGFVFNKREKRPPSNEINALISFGNSLLYSTTLNEIYRTHLNPTISYLHEPRERRFSLSLDISEVFKPIIVDKIIFRTVNKRKIQKDDFNTEIDGCLLDEDGKKTFIKEYEKQLEETIKHNNLNKHVSYQRLLRLEAYKLEKDIIGDKEYSSYNHRN